MLNGTGQQAACLCNARFTGPNRGLCEACEAGKYKDDTGPDPCTDCPSFTSSPTQSNELTDCTCVAGYTGPEGSGCGAILDSTRTSPAAARARRLPTTRCRRRERPRLTRARSTPATPAPAAEVHDVLGEFL